MTARARVPACAMDEDFDDIGADCTHGEYHAEGQGYFVMRPR